jgi:hypothetical protein
MGPEICALLRAIMAPARVGVWVVVLEGSEFARIIGESGEIGDPRDVFSRLSSSLSEIASRPDSSVLK